MAKGKIVSAIDLGSSKVTTLVAQVSVDTVNFDKSVNIIGVSSVDSKGVKKGQIVDIEEAVDSVIQSVEAAERMAGYNIDSAYINLSGAHLSAQNSQGVVAVSNPEGEINTDDVGRVVEAASAVSLPSSREIVHVLPRDFVVDGEAGIKDPVGMSGVRLEVETHLITASSAALKNLKKAMHEVGIKVVEFVYSGLASSESVLTKTEKELGCVMIDIGAGTTSVAVFVDGAISHSVVIPIGAKNVTNDLAIGLRVSLESAEKIKRALSEDEAKSKKIKAEGKLDEFDVASLNIPEIKKVSRKTLIEGIIRPRLNEIFTMVRIFLENESVLTKVPAGIILTGGGAETVGVSESAKRMMPLPVRIGKPRGIEGLTDDIIFPSFSTAVGLILYGSKDMGVETNALTTFSKKFKLPGKGLINKIIGMVKELLP